MATVHLTIAESAIVVATLRLEEPEQFGAAAPSEIIAAVEQWEADKIERRDWSDLTVHQVVQISQQLKREQDARFYSEFQAAHG